MLPSSAPKAHLRMWQRALHCSHRTPAVAIGVRWVSAAGVDGEVSGVGGGTHHRTRSPPPPSLVNGWKKATVFWSGSASDRHARRQRWPAQCALQCLCPRRALRTRWNRSAVPTTWHRAAQAMRTSSQGRWTSSSSISDVDKQGLAQASVSAACRGLEQTGACMREVMIIMFCSKGPAAGQHVAFLLGNGSPGPPGALELAEAGHQVGVVVPGAVEEPRGHHRQKFLEVDLAVAVQVGLVDHVQHLLPAGLHL